MALVDNMIGGYTNHPAEFPHHDTASLESARQRFTDAANALQEAESMVALAAEEKQAAFVNLQTVMKNQIKLSEVDTSGSPEILSFIGWGPKAEAQQIPPPASPTSLKIVAQTENTLFLSWVKAKRFAGGQVRMYIIERRRVNTDPDDWSMAGTSFNPQVKLKDQPQGVKLEYRVKAVNAAGESWPTNSVSVIL